MTLTIKRVHNLPPNLSYVSTLTDITQKHKHDIDELKHWHLGVYASGHHGQSQWLVANTAHACVNTKGCHFEDLLWSSHTNGFFRATIQSHKSVLFRAIHTETVRGRQDKFSVFVWFLRHHVLEDITNAKCCSLPSTMVGKAHAESSHGWSAAERGAAERTGRAVDSTVAGRPSTDGRTDGRHVPGDGRQRWLDQSWIILLMSLATIGQRAARVDRAVYNAGSWPYLIDHTRRHGPHTSHLGHS